MHSHPLPGRWGGGPGPSTRSGAACECPLPFPAHSEPLPRSRRPRAHPRSRDRRTLRRRYSRPPELRPRAGPGCRAGARTLIPPGSPSASLRGEYFVPSPLPPPFLSRLVSVICESPFREREQPFPGSAGACPARRFRTGKPDPRCALPGVSVLINLVLKRVYRRLSSQTII